MKVSILVPIYGVEKYIGKCAQSLFGQTYGDIEYIFVNDCSPDNSTDVLREMLARYPERAGRVRIIHHYTNCGLGAARLTAMQHASGECVMHVDSDDFLPMDAVEQLVAKMEETGADVVDGAYGIYFSENSTEQVLPFKGNTVHYLKRMLCHNVESNRIWGRLYRRSLFEEHQLFPIKGIDYGEDLALVPRLLYFAKRATTDAICYYYRADNNASYTHTISAKANASFLHASKVVFDFFNAVPDAKRYQVALRMGFVDLYRHARRFGMPAEKLDEMGDFWKKCLGSRLCVALYKRKHGYKLATFFYLFSRRLYLTWLQLKYAF